MDIMNSNEYKKWEEENMGCFHKFDYNNRVKFLYEDETHTYHIVNDFQTIKAYYIQKYGKLDNTNEKFLKAWKTYSKKLTTDILADLLFDFHLSKTYVKTNNISDYVSFNELANCIREKLNNVSDAYIGRLLTYMNLPAGIKKNNRNVFSIRSGINKISPPDS